jgi:hypothetical protein
MWGLCSRLGRQMSMRSWQSFAGKQLQLAGVSRWGLCTSQMQCFLSPCLCNRDAWHKGNVLEYVFTSLSYSGPPLMTWRVSYLRCARLWDHAVKKWVLRGVIPSLLWFLHALCFHIYFMASLQYVTGPLEVSFKYTLCILVFLPMTQPIDIVQTSSPHMTAPLSPPSL